jgi:hypothetical protein
MSPFGRVSVEKALGLRSDVAVTGPFVTEGGVVFLLDAPADASGYGIRR